MHANAPHRDLSRPRGSSVDPGTSVLLPRSDLPRADSGERQTPVAYPRHALRDAALRAVWAAAVASLRWSGRGHAHAADAAATAAMRGVLEAAPGTGTVVAGEGEKDGAPMLAPGERLGRGGVPLYDIAVDPLECTDLCAKGLPGALTTIAVAESGAMWKPGPAYYMDKLVVGRDAREAIDLEAGPEENARRVARVLGKRLPELRVVVLDKPRHHNLIAELCALGPRVITPPAGDVAGALAAVLPDGDADMLVGVGGAPEGVLTACAVHALGGAMQARLAPQRPHEARALVDAGADLSAILQLDDLVRGAPLFAAAGVTGGGLVRAPWTADGALHVEALVVADGSATRVVDRFPPLYPEDD